MQSADAGIGLAGFYLGQIAPRNRGFFCKVYLV
jgi:hypothetical protein